MNLMKHFIIFLAILLWPVSAWSYIPTVDEFLTDISAKRVQLSSLEAVYEFPVKQEGKKDGSMPKDQNENTAPEVVSSSNMAQEKVSFRSPDRIRLNITRRDREEVFLAVGLKTMALSVDQTQEVPWPQPFLLFRLLIDSEAARLRELLSAFGFDLKKITLGRYEDMIVYILGARPGDLSEPQAWFERDTLHLRRLILPPTRNAPGYDLELSGYRLHEQRVDWPGVLISRINNSPPLTMNLKTLTINPITDTGLSNGNHKEAPSLTPKEILAKDPDIIRIRKMMERMRKKLE